MSPSADQSTSVSGAIKAHWRALLSEVVSTALLLLLGVAACLPVKGPQVSRLNKIKIIFISFLTLRVFGSELRLMEERE